MSTLDAAQRDALSDSDFAYIDKDGGRHLPINDADHVRAALARFDQTQFESDAAKTEAHAKILAAAKKFGIDTAKQAGEPDAGDVHADQPLTNAGQGPKRSPMLKRLMQGLRTRAKTKRYLTAEDIETEYRSALGHAGGKSRKADEPSDAEICDVCQGLPVDDMPADGCTCAACQEGDPDDCVCREMAMDDEGDVDPDAYTEGSPHIHSESGEHFRLFLPTEFAEAPATINYLPKPGTYTHPTYGPIEITPERNQAFVANFQAGVYQDRLPIDAEHQTKLSGAAGWITAMQQNPDGSVDAAVDWTPRGKALLASDGFRYFSPEWYDAWQQPETGQKIQNVPIGGAITTRPFFKPSSLRPLVANETGFTIPDDPTPFTAPSGHSQELPIMADEQTPVTLTEDEIKRFREMESENASLRQAAESAQAEAKAAAERVAVIETENRRRVFAEQASPWHGETDKHVSFMEALPSDELRQQYAETMSAQATALTEALKASKVFTAVGYAGGDSTAMSRLEQVAATIKASEPTLSDAQAKARALKSDPSLYTEYEATARS